MFVVSLVRTKTQTVMQKLEFKHPALVYAIAEDGVEYGADFIMVSGKMEVCPECGGTGSHVRKDLDDSAMVDSMREDGDEEGLRAYFNGAFDERCTLCNGDNVVLCPNWDDVPQWAKDAVESWEESRRYSEEISRQERAMGA